MTRFIIAKDAGYSFEFWNDEPWDGHWSDQDSATRYPTKGLAINAARALNAMVLAEIDTDLGPAHQVIWDDGTDFSEICEELPY